MANTPCGPISKAMGTLAYDTASKINGWNTFLWINKNAVDKMRIRLKGDFLSPLDGLGFSLESLGVVDKYLNNNQKLTDLRYKYLKQAQELAVPLIHKIVKGETVDFSKYKKHAQKLGKDIKVIDNMVKDGNLKVIDDAVKATTYNMLNIVQGYVDSFNDMKKTISQHEKLMAEGMTPYKHYMSIKAEELLLGALSNLGDMLSSPHDVEKFIRHSSKQDFLRLLERFNHEPLIGISDLSSPEAIELSKQKFYSIFDPSKGIDSESFVKDSEYKNLILSMNGEYNPAKMIAGDDMSSTISSIVRTTADLRRGFSATLNAGMATALTVGSYAGYTVKAIGDLSQDLYRLDGMDELFDALGIEKMNIWNMQTRADLNDIVSAGRGSGELSHVNRAAEWVRKNGTKLLENVGVNEFIATGVAEGAGESLKGLHNSADTASKYQILASSLLSSLRYHQFPNKQSFLNYLHYTENKEALIQSIREKMEDYIQFSSGFYSSSSWNISTLQRNKWTQPLMYLSTRGINLMRNFVEGLGFGYAHRFVEGMTGKINGTAKAGHGRYDDILNDMLKDTKLTSTYKYLFSTMFLGHKVQEGLDNEDDGASTLEIGLRSFGKFGRWSNNYMQAIESNREGRLMLGVTEGYNNPYIKNDKVLSMVSKAWQSFSRDYLSVLKGSEMALEITKAATEGLYNGGVNGMFEEGYNAYMKSTHGFNRYFIDQIDGALDSSNVPLTQRDGLSMLFGKHINSISEMKGEIRDAINTKNLKENTFNWLATQMLYNNSIGKALNLFINGKYDPYKKEKGMVDIINQIDSMGLGILVEEGKLPPTEMISEDPDIQEKRDMQVLSIIKGLGIYGGNKSQTLAGLFESAGIREQDVLGSTYTYSDMKKVSDRYLLSKLSSKDLKELEALYNGDNVKGQKTLLVEKQILNYINYNTPGGGAVALSKMLYLYDQKLTSEFAKKKYAKESDLEDKEIVKKNRILVNKFGPLLSQVALPEYTNLMTKFISLNPEFKKLKGIVDEDGIMSKDLQNSYRSYMTVASKGIADDVYNASKVVGRMNGIKDDGWKMRVISHTIDTIDSNPNFGGEVGLALKARILYDNKKFIFKAMKDESFMNKYSDDIGKMLEFYYGTYDHIQKNKDYQAIQAALRQ